MTNCEQKNQNTKKAIILSIANSIYCDQNIKNHCQNNGFDVVMVNFDNHHHYKGFYKLIEAINQQDQKVSLIVESCSYYGLGQMMLACILATLKLRGLIEIYAYSEEGSVPILSLLEKEYDRYLMDLASTHYQELLDNVKNNNDRDT